MVLVILGLLFANIPFSVAMDDIHCCASVDASQCRCVSPFVPEPVSFVVQYSSLSCAKYRCRWAPPVEEAPASSALDQLVEQAQLAAQVHGPSADCAPGTEEASGPSPSPIPPPTPTIGESILGDLSLFPPKCGYQWQGFSISRFEANMKKLLSSEPPAVGCSGYPNMCVSASFLAFLLKLRRLKDAGLIGEDQLQKAASTASPQWVSWNMRTLPGEAISRLKDVHGKPLGVSKSLARTDLPQAEWPKPGDFVQLWRRNGSGHSFVFEGYLKDIQGRSIGLCYWTASKPTGGYGRMCEPLSVVQTLNIGRFTQ
jgi:hypothetical protein